MPALLETIPRHFPGAASVQQQHVMSQFDLACLTAALKPFPKIQKKELSHDILGTS
jgi:hypothetical protein